MQCLIKYENVTVTTEKSEGNSHSIKAAVTDDDGKEFRAEYKYHALY